MRFSDPHWLYGLLALPPIALWFVLEQRGREARFRRFADPAVWSAIAPELDLRARLRKGLVWLAALGFALVALARPQWGKVEETVKVSGMDILLALDVSGSMEVEDVVPSRLKRAKRFTRGLIDRLSGDRVGVVAFAGSAYLASPLTNDLAYVNEIIESLDPRLMTSQGTDIGAALETAARALERGAEEGTDPAATGDSSRVVLLISDGEDHQEQAEAGVRRLKEAGVRVYVVGVGTEKGGPIPTRDENGQLFGYKRDRKGDAVVSRFTPEALSSLARAGDGRYWTLSPGEGELDAVIDELGKQQRSDYTERRRVTYEERYQLFLLVALLLLLLEMSLPARRIRPRSAGVPVAGAALLLAWAIGLGAASRVHADDGLLGPDVSLKGYLKNREGLRAFEGGDAAAARQRFEEAAKADPRRAELLYNQGVAKLKGGDVDGALGDLGAAAQRALETGDAELWGRAHLGLGNAHAAKGEQDGAVESYLKALEAARVAERPDLDAAARKNLQLLATQPPPPPSESQAKQDPKDGQQPPEGKSGESKPDSGKAKDQAKNEQGKPDKPDRGEGSGKDGKRPPSQKFAGVGGKQNFDSEKLSPEDAERVMAELSSRERNLQDKLRRQRAGARARNEKDW